jgi:hypothetical protein
VSVNERTLINTRHSGCSLIGKTTAFQAEVSGSIPDTRSNNMKSLHLRNIAGQVNLKGKKYLRLTCRCCVVIDLRKWYFDKLDQKEIRLFSSNW